MIEQMGGETMPQLMRRHVQRNAGVGQVPLDDQPHPHGRQSRAQLADE